MNKKVLSVLVIVAMVSTCLAVLETADSNAEPSNVTYKNLTDLVDQSGWWVNVTYDDNTRVYSISYNPGGNACVVQLNLTKPGWNSYEVNIVPNGTNHNFIIGANCGFEDLNGCTHGYSDLTAYFNVGRTVDDYVNLTIRNGGYMNNVYIFGLIGTLTIDKGGIFNDGYTGSNIADHPASIFIKTDEFGPTGEKTHSSIVIKEGGIAQSLNVYAMNESGGRGTPTLMIALENVTSATVNDYAKITCISLQRIVIEGVFTHTDGNTAKMMFKTVSASPENFTVVFDGVTYKEINQINLENFNSKIRIKGGFEDIDTLFYVSANGSLDNNVFSDTTDEINVIMKYTYLDNGKYADPELYYGRFDDTKRVAVGVSLTVYKSANVTDITIDNEARKAMGLLMYNGNIIAAQDQVINLNKIYKVSVADGWQFDGWYYIDDHGIEQKITDPEHVEMSFNYVIYAKATAVQDVPTSANDNTPLFIIIVGVFIILIIADMAVRMQK